VQQAIEKYSGVYRLLMKTKLGDISADISTLFHDVGDEYPDRSTSFLGYFWQCLFAPSVNKIGSIFKLDERCFSKKNEAFLF